MSIEHLAPTLKHVGPVDALKARLEAATAWRRSVGAVDGFDDSWCDLDKRAREAKIEAAIALAREPEPEPAPEPAPAPPRRRQRQPSLKYVLEQAMCSGAPSVDVPGGYRVNLTGRDDAAPSAPGANPWDVVLPGAKNGAR
jgi:hypothetical protein